MNASNYDCRDSWYEEWLRASRIHVSKYSEKCWIAVAYTANKEVIEYERGETEKSAVEKLCKSIRVKSFWAIYEPSLKVTLMRILKIIWNVMKQTGRNFAALFKRNMP